MSNQIKKLSWWEKNKKFFTPLPAFVASLKIIKLCSYYLLKRIPTYIWASLHLLGVFAWSLIMFFFNANLDPEAVKNIKNFESISASFFAYSVYAVQVPFSVLFGIYVSTRVFKAMSQEGYDLILSSKPFYRQQVVASKILFLLIALSLYSSLMVIEYFIFLASWGLKHLNVNIFSLLLFCFFGNLISGFLFATMAGLISTRFSENVAFLLTFLSYYGSGWLGEAIQPLAKTITSYKISDSVKKMMDTSREKSHTPFFFNNFVLNWKSEKPKNLGKLLFTKDQSREGSGFDKDEIAFFEKMDQVNRSSTSLARFLGWTNIPHQLSTISPISEAELPLSGGLENNFLESWDEKLFSPWNAHRNYQSLSSAGDIDTSFLLKTITPQSKETKDLLTVVDSKTNQNYFLVPSIFIASPGSYLNVEVTPIQENSQSLQTTQSPKRRFTSSLERGKNPLNFSALGIVFGSEKFQTFMEKFFESEFYSKEEKAKKLKLFDSPNVTKDWFIKRLASRIESFGQENSDFIDKDLLIYFIGGLYWSYLNYSNSRLAKVIGSNNNQLTDFEPKPLEVTLGELKYKIGGGEPFAPRHSLFAKEEESPTNNSLLGLESENTSQKTTKQEDYFRPNYLFSYTQNYVVLEKWNDVVSKWAFVSFWVFLTLIFILGLVFVLVRRDFK